MTKQELKNGMILETRDGFKYLYCEGILMATIGWEDINNYNDNLIIKDRDFSYFDIIKVYKDKGAHALQNIFKDYNLSLIWQRPETPKLSEREIEILKALDVLGFTYITRDFHDKSLVAHVSKPIKRQFIWGCVYEAKFLEKNLFDFITFADEKPTSIQELLSDIEKGKKDE